MTLCTLRVNFCAALVGRVSPGDAAASIAALYALVSALVICRALSALEGYRQMVDSAREAATVGIVIGFALIFNCIVAPKRIPATLSRFLTELDLSPLALIILNLVPDLSLWLSRHSGDGG